MLFLSLEVVGDIGGEDGFDFEEEVRKYGDGSSISSDENDLLAEVIESLNVFTSLYFLPKKRAM